MIGKHILGSYITTRLLGQGGMGAVYVAEHATLRTKLAVKVLLPEAAQHAHVVQRFIAEAKAASAIDNPHIIKVFDAGQLETGEHFIALEFLDGYPVTDLTGQRPLDEVLKVMAQVASGLEAAHGRGIIHRDLKPDNLFITPQPGNPLLVKILDFGIAKLMTETLAGDIKTGTNMVMGTPAYMSPEQARGSADVDPLTDVYAMGAIGYQLVTGQRAYSPMSIGDLVAKQVGAPPPEPRMHRPDLPAGWSAVIRQAMAVLPALRPQSARAFAELLADATPTGRAIVTSVGFETRAPAGSAAPDTLTRPESPHARAASTPTTLGHAAAQSQPAQPVPGPKRGRWALPLGVALVAGLVGLGIAAVGTSPSTTSRSGPNETPITSGQESGAAEAPTPAALSFQVFTEPTGARVLVDGAALGEAPVMVRRPAGAEISVRAELDGYQPAEETVLVSQQTDRVRLELAPLVEAATGTDAGPASSSEQAATNRTGRATRKQSPPKKAVDWDVPVGEETLGEIPVE